MQELIETFEISSRATLRLLNDISDEQFAATITKGKTIQGHFAHIHNVRLMWIKSAVPTLMGSLAKLEPPVSKQSVADNLQASERTMTELISTAESPNGRIKGFKPHAAAFVGYLCAHEAFHRAQIELGLRQAGIPISDKTAYALWEWGVL